MNLEKVQRLLDKFLSTPSARRATLPYRCLLTRRPYFYPRPPRGGRRGPLARWPMSCYFYPRPPRGGRLCAKEMSYFRFPFLSTPSARRATYYSLFSYNDKNISIHALREEGDPECACISDEVTIFLSTPSARRATLAGFVDLSGYVEFLSTPSARRATTAGGKRQARRNISIHALREEGD